MWVIDTDGMEIESVTLHYEGEEYEFQVERRSDVAQVHMYVKEIWWGLPKEADAEAYIHALEHYVNRLEALLDNGWELIDSDGEHLYFEKEQSNSTKSNDFEVTDQLE